MCLFCSTLRSLGRRDRCSSYQANEVSIRRLWYRGARYVSYDVHGCGRWRRRRGASHCFEASVFILSPLACVACMDLVATSRTFSVLCASPQVGGTCVWVVCEAHCLCLLGPIKHSTRPSNTISLALSSLSVGCHPTSRGLRQKEDFLLIFVMCASSPLPPLPIFLFELGSRVLSENWPGVRSSSHLTTILFSGSSDKGSLKGTALARVVPVVTAAVGFSLWAQWL